MKKFLYLFVIVAFIATSCTKNEVVEPEPTAKSSKLILTVHSTNLSTALLTIEELGLNERQLLNGTGTGDYREFEYEFMYPEFQNKQIVITVKTASDPDGDWTPPYDIEEQTQTVVLNKPIIDLMFEFDD